MAFCVNCGKELSGGFCSNCGQKVTETAKMEQEREEINTEEQDAGKQSQKIIGGIISAIFIIAGLFFFLIGYNNISPIFDSAEVKMVKNGTLYSCPNYTVEQLVNGYMGNPSWSSGTSTDGIVFVNIEGDITYMDKEVRALMQFEVKNETFEFRAIEINNVPVMNLLAIGLLNNMCEAAKE